MFWKSVFCNLTYLTFWKQPIWVICWSNDAVQRRLTGFVAVTVDQTYENWICMQQNRNVSETHKSHDRQLCCSVFSQRNFKVPFIHYSCCIVHLNACQYEYKPDQAVHWVILVNIWRRLRGCALFLYEFSAIAGDIFRSDGWDVKLVLAQYASLVYSVLANICSK